jgi:hypothetical protein
MKRSEMWERLESSAMRGQMAGFSIEHRYMLPSRVSLRGEKAITREQLVWAVKVIRDWNRGETRFEPEPAPPRGRMRHRGNVKGVLPQ